VRVENFGFFFDLAIVDCLATITYYELRITN